LSVGGSHGTGSRGAGGGESDVGVGWEEGVTGDGKNDGGMLRLGGGETRNLLLPSQSRRRSTLFCLFLILFAGGGAVSGDKRPGPRVGDGAAGVAMGGVVARAGTSGAALATLPHIQWR
jgi:hypothetical protein